MELKYLDEYIKDNKGEIYQVLDLDSIDFSESQKGIKIKEFLVIRADGGELIETINSKNSIESTYVASKGDAIFCNNNKDLYVPRDNFGNSIKYDKIEEHGYIKIGSEKTTSLKPQIKVQSKVECYLLPNIIKKPTVIKDAFGKNNHQFLLAGSTLKKDIKTNQITGIDPIAYMNTWKLISNK